MRKHGKLVRDKVPGRIKAKGEPYVAHPATEAEYRRALLAKLVEEIREFGLERTLDELVDVLEVVEAVIVFFGFDRSVLDRGRALAADFTPGEFEDRDVEYDVIAMLDDYAATFVNGPGASALISMLARLNELAGFQGFARSEIEAARLAKLETHGGFEKRIILDES